MGIIVSAFPGSGKDIISESGISGLKVIDSNPSDFDQKDFPENYISHIKENIEKTDIIFVSSDKKVRDALDAEELNYDLFYPSKDRRIEFLENYVRMHYSGLEIQRLDHNFEKWIDEIEDEESEFCHKHKMEIPRMFLADDPMIQAYISTVTSKR